ncbi:MAG: DHH family phosphoesterase [Candidatus Lindowbacteria bacterium]|nr:DHH family phosphoesterase [Candidatus Lindowbacteria bacterium]
MSYNSGDIVGYKNKLEEFRAYIFDLKGKVLIAHHGDCDGMVGGGLLAAFINQNLPAVTQVTYASSAEFRKQDFDYFSQFTEDCDFGIFVEGQGMTQDYGVLNEKFINIDHHPHPEDTPIKRMLNPRNFAIQPNPAISYVMYELFSEHLPPEASWIAALGSIVDYCPLPAEKIIAAHTKELEEADALRDTFLACQYVLPLTCQLAEFIATMPTPQALLAAEPYASRRVIYQNKIKEAISGAAISQDTVVAKTTVGEYRISSPWPIDYRTFTMIAA